MIHVYSVRSHIYDLTTLTQTLSKILNFISFDFSASSSLKSHYLNPNQMFGFAYDIQLYNPIRMWSYLLIIHWMSDRILDVHKSVQIGFWMYIHLFWICFIYSPTKRACMLSYGWKRYKAPWTIHSDVWLSTYPFILI